MADYNIYIRAMGVGSDSQVNPTMPWSQREDKGGGGQTSSNTNVEGALGKIMKGVGYMSNPDSLIGKAFSNIGKAFPVVAVAYAVVKLAEGIIDNTVDIVTQETGDYKQQIAWQNQKNAVRLIFHPFSSSLEAFKTTRKIYRENQKLSLQRDLLGDSVINSYTGRGV